ncbi:GntR family transcriptional regulator [Streptomyces sp. NPDC001604]|uniref:GntR family transcriptional regulator n=1 Tax=Streptomyces sp. NPDC001604 TaxID=3364593 RepID=UPI0036737C01
MKPRPVSANEARRLRDSVAVLILGRIKDGTYPVGTVLPARWLIAEELGVSRSTVDVACRALTGQGYLVGVPGRGRGTVVLDPLNPSAGPDVHARTSEGQCETWPGPGSNRDMLEHITAGIRQRIADGTYPTGQRIPSVAQIAAQSGTRTWLARQAVDALKAEGLLYCRNPKGHFVSADAVSASAPRAAH